MVSERLDAVVALNLIVVQQSNHCLAGDGVSQVYRAYIDDYVDIFGIFGLASCKSAINIDRWSKGCSNPLVAV